ncbi:hypothetical protein PUN28_005751 [Cardiocondyla obscurior]|uniref:Uncharacterized protein n=1 Tax=Cardiocondyla obscurior TaxID=286306 RepID=A0AAW2G5Z4_9HYME
MARDSKDSVERRKCMWRTWSRLEQRNLPRGLLARNLFRRAQDISFTRSRCANTAIASVQSNEGIDRKRGGGRKENSPPRYREG